MILIGEKVIVTTCAGQFRGVVKGHTQFSFDKDSRAYQVTGPDIQTTTRKVILDDGRKLFKGPTCSFCDNSDTCCFKAKEDN